MVLGLVTEVPVLLFPAAAEVTLDLATSFLGNAEWDHFLVFPEGKVPRRSILDHSMPSLAARAFISCTYQMRSAMTRRTNVPTMAAIHLAVQGMSSQGTASVGALMTSASWGTVNSNSLSLRPVFARNALNVKVDTFPFTSCSSTRRRKWEPGCTSTTIRG